MLPEFAQSLYERFNREGIPLLLAGGGRCAITAIPGSPSMWTGFARAQGRRMLWL
jgi:hypothetical protein